MALDRWLALIILLICLAYGYAAYFTMDSVLPPILKRSPVWPSSFPKVLVIGAIVFSLIILLGIEKAPPKKESSELSFANLLQYKWGQAVALLGLMIAYALLLRPLGFLLSTFLFLSLGSHILGERRYLMMAIIAGIAAGSIWYLVDAVLGIFLSPFPAMLSGG